MTDFLLFNWKFGKGYEVAFGKNIVFCSRFFQRERSINIGSSSNLSDYETEMCRSASELLLQFS